MDKIPKIPGNEITDPRLYFSRRAIMKAGLGIASVGRNCLGLPPIQSAFHPRPRRVLLPTTNPSAAPSPWATSEPKTSYDDITHWNNFYEFSTNKQDVADAAAGFQTAGWKVSVGGLVSKPATSTWTISWKLAPIEERVYRMRCVEAWSMVVPWNGYPISALLDRVQPLSSAKFVAF